MIFTDPIILRMLGYLHDKNPYKNSFIFYGLNPDHPVRGETLEKYTEKALAETFGEAIQKSFDQERSVIAKALAIQSNIREDEYIGFSIDKLDALQKTISITQSYTIQGNTLKVQKYKEKRLITVDQDQMRKLVSFCGKSPSVFIFSGAERKASIDFNILEDKQRKQLARIMGEIARKERNISFHGFRHFFNSTIRGTVSDDILRLQTGHSDERMTDTYDHMTDDRGEQLRKAVQAKILPFIPKAVGE
ncbi:hypothetical protein FACS1894110_01880 [Spirochaetia bacterium]|nr:hypothetical protein FACS1894110_01880 [Spirochaetia bacterium]